MDDTRSKRTFFVGDSSVLVRRDGMEICNPITNGVITDWEAAERLWERSIANLRLQRPGTSASTVGAGGDKEAEQRNGGFEDSTNRYAFMYAEPTFNTREARERVAEHVFEKYGVSGFFVCKNAVLSSSVSRLFFDVEYTNGGPGIGLPRKSTRAWLLISVLGWSLSRPSSMESFCARVALDRASSWY